MLILFVLNVNTSLFGSRIFFWSLTCGLLWYNVKQYNYDMSAYGFREFFRRHETAFQQQDG
jgi:hypothetical protein